MAEERDPLSTSNGTAEIKSEIERTRVEMSETIGEIQERLRPDHLLQQARDGVKEAAAGKARSIMNSAGETAVSVAHQARGVGDSLVDYVRQHPLQAAVTVGALTWWLLRDRDRSEDWYGTYDTSWDDADELSYNRELPSNREPSLRNRVGEYASSARESVGAYASTARESVGEYAASARESVSEYATSARQTAGEYAVSARERARRASAATRRAASSATTTVDDWVHDNPLAVGALALAVGAAIGMSVPGTEVEDRTMGEARDRAWDRASKAAAEIKENVTRKVETVAENFVNENVIDPLNRTASEPLGRA